MDIVLRKHFLHIIIPHCLLNHQGSSMNLLFSTCWYTVGLLFYNLHYFPVAGALSIVWCRSCRQHFHTIIAARRRRNGYEVPHMPLSIVLTFLSPTGPQQSLPCGTQNVGWRHRLTGGEHFDESPNIPREESLRHYCFPNISFYIQMQRVILHIENKLSSSHTWCNRAWEKKRNKLAWRNSASSAAAAANLVEGAKREATSPLSSTAAEMPQSGAWNKAWRKCSSRSTVRPTRQGCRVCTC